MRSSQAIPLHRRLGFRVGLALFVGLLAVDLLLLPLWNFLYWRLSMEWFDPEYVRAYADRLEGMTGEEIVALQWDHSMLSAQDHVVIITVTALYAAVFALLLGALVARLATRRVSNLSLQVLATEQGRVPGPFQVTGDDEIGVLAGSMNEMRGKVLALLEEIERTDAARRTWVAEVSHDLRTPLTALGVALDQASAFLTVKTAPQEHQDELSELVRSARLDVARVVDLAEDLLEIARLDAGAELDLEPAPVGQLVRDALASLRPLGEQEGVLLELELADRLPELDADGRRLVRALENIVLNSIQHAVSRVSVVVQRDKNQVLITVKDDGPGLPEDESGSSVHSLRKHLSRPDSAGIGLEVADKVVRAHGGSLAFANSPSGGALVTVRLPDRRG